MPETDGYRRTNHHSQHAPRHRLASRGQKTGKDQADEEESDDECGQREGRARLYEFGIHLFVGFSGQDTNRVVDREGSKEGHRRHPMRRGGHRIRR